MSHLDAAHLATAYFSHLDAAHFVTAYFAVAFLTWCCVLVRHGDYWDSEHLLSVILWPLMGPLLAAYGALLLVHRTARKIAGFVESLTRREGA